MLELEKILIKKGVSQKKLAEMLNMAPQNVSRLIKSDDIKVSVLQKIASVLNVSVSTFFDEPATTVISDDSPNLENLTASNRNLSETVRTQADIIKNLTSK